MKESTKKALDEAANNLAEQHGEDMNGDGWKYHSAKRFIGITENDNLVLVDLDLGGKVAAFYFKATDAKPLKASDKKAKAKAKKAKRKADEDEEDNDGEE